MERSKETKEGWHRMNSSSEEFGIYWKADGTVCVEMRPGEYHYDMSSSAGMAQGVGEELIYKLKKRRES
ncbi:MAG: hypothetical protein P4L62_04265 [Candidatus Pacebacteria bacterium]|nr:hypothetical protein [Candidatus Paceibacterota bacterium]MDR3583545.1 hypothetical protein [Candidatus Paceibacterota bacterium]